MATIEFVDQSLRDGQQSLWGMRLRAGHVLPIADAIDSAGYRVVDLTGSSPFEVQVRYNREDPWKGLDLVRAALPNIVLRAGTRSNWVVGMGITPDSIIELWIRTLAKHGIQSLWIFDCLHDTAKMLDVARKARDAGLAPSPQVNFSLSPVHTDEYYAQVSERMSQPRDRLVAVNAVRDHLREYRVVVRCDRPAREAGGVHAHVGAVRRGPAGEGSGARHEAAHRALGVHAGLDRVAGDLDVLLRDQQRRAAGNPKLLAHHVNAGHHLGHGVLHL